MSRSLETVCQARAAVSGLRSLVDSSGRECHPPAPSVTGMGASPVAQQLVADVLSGP